MKQSLYTLWFGIREPFKKTNYIFIFFVLFIVFFSLFIFIPVWTVSGNTIATQLDVFTLRDYVVLILLSSFSSLFITMQVYAIGLRRKIESVSTVTAGGLGALFAGIAGTAFCASCLAALFGLIGLGTGSVFFVLQNQIYFLVGAIVAMLVSLYFAARKVKRVCNSC